MNFINKYKSPNYNYRKKDFFPQYIIIHYTAMRSYIEAINYLCNKKNKVSSHFLINKLGKIYYLVDVNLRAWHAGNSKWKKNTDLNSSSIGIEIDNSGHHLDFEAYTTDQLKSLNKLLNYLLTTYQISESNILGHSDIAPYRKIDPGEKFPWNNILKFKKIKLPRMSEKKIIIKVESFLKKKLIYKIKNKALYMLKEIGYDIGLAKKNNKYYLLLIKAYQMHFRQDCPDGNLDGETYKILINHYNQTLTR